MKYQLMGVIEEHVPTPEEMARVTFSPDIKPIHQQPDTYFEKANDGTINFLVNHQHHFFDNNKTLCAVLNMSYKFNISSGDAIEDDAGFQEMCAIAFAKMKNKQAEISPRPFEILPLLPPIKFLVARLAEMYKPDQQNEQEEI